VRLPWPIREARLARLAARAGKGDRTAVVSIYRALHPDVSRFVGRRVASRAEAEDAVAATFHRLLESLGRLDGSRGSVTGYALAVARTVLREGRCASAPPAPCVSSGSRWAEAPEGSLPMSETIASRLRRLARPPILPGESHRRSLETELADRHGSAPKENTMYTVLFRTGIAAGLLAAVGAGASQLPATYQAEVGKRIEIRAPQPPDPGAVQAAVKSIEAGAEAGKREIQVRVRVTADPAGAALVRIDAFGDTIGLDGIPAAIRSSSPSFATAEITVQPVEGSVEGDLGSLVGTKVLGERLSDAQVEAAVRKELATDGVTGDVQVDVKTDDADGKVRREVRVIVTKEKEAGAP
jgi:hypothetical protein